MKKHSAAIMIITLFFTLSFMAQNLSAQVSLDKSLKKAKKSKDEKEKKVKDVKTENDKKTTEVKTNDNISSAAQTNKFEWGDEVEILMDGKDGSDDSHWVKGQIDEVKGDQYKVLWENESGDRMETWAPGNHLKKAAPKEVYRLREELKEVKEKIALGSLDDYSFSVYFDRAKERIDRIKEDFPDYTDISKQQAAWSGARKDFEQMKKDLASGSKKKQKVYDDKDNEDDWTKWDYPYNDFMRDIHAFKAEVGQYAGKPLYDFSGSMDEKNGRADIWMKRIYDKKEHDEWTSRWFGGDSDHPMTKKTLAALEALKQSIDKIGGPEKLIILDQYLKEKLDLISGVQKTIEQWDGELPLYRQFSQEETCVKAAVSASERTDWVEQNFYRWKFYQEKVNTMLDELAQSINKKGGMDKVINPINDVALLSHIDDIAEAVKIVKEYDPAKHIWIARNEVIERAVSKKVRDEFVGKWGYEEAGKKQLTHYLNVLETTCKTKIPLNKPSNDYFAFRNAADENMIKAKLGDLAKLKIHKIGLANQEWLIEKNELGIPINRFKRGYVWVTDTTNDYPYCHLYQVSLIQDYAGGGTYGATYTSFANDWIVGCP
ncbi:hypothetical protein K1X84_09250 [bacterium]|nr:hypothetical protein [bacterium]